MSKNRGPVVQIGGATEHVKTAVPALSAAIMKVLNSAAGDDVKKAAVAALSDAAGGAPVNGASIMNSTFSVGVG